MRPSPPFPSIWTVPPLQPYQHPPPRPKQLCPVCNGKTTVAYDFYPDENVPTDKRANCRSCMGRGIV